MAADGDNGVRTLTAVMEHEKLTMEQVLAWASEIADEVSQLHEQGNDHGDIRPDEVWIEGGSARLGPAASGAIPNASRDIQQFSAVLRQMLDRVRNESSGEVREALEDIAATNTRALAGCSMRKVATALRVLRFSRQVELLSKRTETAQPISEAPPEKPARRRFRPRLIHAWAFFGIAAAISFLGSFLFVQFTH